MDNLILNDVIEQSSNEDGLKNKYLTFWTDSQLFGVPIADVVQIVKVQQITQIPEFPHYAKGIINLRGSIIPVVDVRLRFGKEEIPYNDKTCIIVTNIKDVSMGFIVDGVEEVTDITDDQISEPPRMSSDTTNVFLTGVGKLEDKIVLLINTTRILGDDFDVIQNLM